MNKYKVIILSLLISFMGASCEDWLYDNVNEDAAHEVLPNRYCLSCCSTRLNFNSTMPNTALI